MKRCALVTYQGIADQNLFDISKTKDGGLEKLNLAVVHYTINPILKKMLLEADVARDEVIAFVDAGNTTMSHLLYWACTWTISAGNRMCRPWSSHPLSKHQSWE